MTTLNTEPFFDPFRLSEEAVEQTTDILPSIDLKPLALAPLATMLLPVQAAYAKDGAYGIFEGRIASLMHPTTMALLFLTSLYSLSLGLEWRKLRTLGDDIKQLNAQLPKLASASAPVRYPLSKVVSAVNEEISAAGEDETKVASLRRDLSTLESASAMALDAQIRELTDTRKTLAAKNLKDKHEITGSWLLGGGVVVSILGGFNTYMRAGKLFPGPHLYAGMAITGLWAAAAALVPAMQKGNETARTLHITLNCINLALFAWQVNTGIGITLKVIEFTKFP